MNVRARRLLIGILAIAVTSAGIAFIAGWHRANSLDPSARRDQQTRGPQLVLRGRQRGPLPEPSERVRSGFLVVRDRATGAAQSVRIGLKRVPERSFVAHGVRHYPPDELAGVQQLTLASRVCSESWTEQVQFPLDGETVLQVDVPDSSISLVVVREDGSRVRPPVNVQAVSVAPWEASEQGDRASERTLAVAPQEISPADSVWSTRVDTAAPIRVPRLLGQTALVVVQDADGYTGSSIVRAEAREVRIPLIKPGMAILVECPEYGALTGLWLRFFRVDKTNPGWVDTVAADDVARLAVPPMALGGAFTLSPQRDLGAQLPLSIATVSTPEDVARLELAYAGQPLRVRFPSPRPTRFEVRSLAELTASRLRVFHGPPGYGRLFLGDMPLSDGTVDLPAWIESPAIAIEGLFGDQWISLLPVRNPAPALVPQDGYLLTGSVVDESSTQPIEGARVQAIQYHGSRARRVHGNTVYHSDRDGRFRMWLPNRHDVGLMVELDGYAAAVVGPMTEGLDSAVVRLQRLTPLRIRVRPSERFAFARYTCYLSATVRPRIDRIGTADGECEFQIPSDPAVSGEVRSSDGVTLRWVSTDVHDGLVLLTAPTCSVRTMAVPATLPARGLSARCEWPTVALSGESDVEEHRARILVPEADVIGSVVLLRSEITLAEWRGRSSELPSSFDGLLIDRWEFTLRGAETEAALIVADKDSREVHVVSVGPGRVSTALFTRGVQVVRVTPVGGVGLELRPGGRGIDLRGLLVEAQTRVDSDLQWELDAARAWDVVLPAATWSKNSGIPAAVSGLVGGRDVGSLTTRSEGRERKITIQIRWDGANWVLERWRG